MRHDTKEKKALQKKTRLGEKYGNCRITALSFLEREQEVKSTCFLLLLRKSILRKAPGLVIRGQPMSYLKIKKTTAPCFVSD